MKSFALLQRILARVLGGLCALIFAALVLDVLWGVFTRQVLNAQPAWTEELARFLLVWLAVLGGVLAYAGDRHPGVDILSSRLDPAARRLARLTSHLSVLGFALAVLLIGGGQLFAERWDSGQMMASLGIRKAWFYLVLPIGGGLISLLAVEKLLIHLKSPLEEEEVR